MRGEGSADIRIKCSSYNYTKEHILWWNVKNRSTSSAYKELKPTYKDVILCDDWLSFSKFVGDIKTLHNYEKFLCGTEFEFDKDILSGEYKVYSKDTCCFVPKKLNMLLSGSKSRKNLPVGVSKNRRGLYESYISIDNKKINLGLFETVNKAKSAYDRAKRERCDFLLSYYDGLGLIDSRIKQAILAKIGS